MKVKHLEMIQDVIKRMANNSLNIKGWLVAIITACLIFVSKDYSKYCLLATFILIFGFLVLDAKYLQYERKYRQLYSIVIKKEKTDFSMSTDIEEIKSNKRNYLIKCVFSISVALPYLLILLYNLALFLIAFYC